jgi:O-antigen ligase
VLLVGAAAVPCVFTTRLDDVFTLPKLVALWALTVVALVALCAGATARGRAVLAAPTAWVLDVAFVAFLAWNVVAFVASTDRHQSLFGERYQYQGLLTIGLYGAAFLLARLAFASPGRRDMLLFAAVATGGGFVAGYAIVQELGLDPIWHGYLPAGRVFSSLGQSNALAAYLVLVLPVTAYLCRRTAGRARALAIAVVGAEIVALAFTYSRGGYLAALAMVPVAAIVGARDVRANARRIALGVGGAIAVVALLATTVAPVREQLDRSWGRLVSTTDTGEASVRTHLDLWDAALAMTADHPVTGTGQETYPDQFPTYIHRFPYLRAMALSEFRIESPHDVYLAVAAGAGIPALVAYLTLLGAIAVVLVRAARRDPDPRRRWWFAALATALAAHLVTDAFMTADLLTTWLFWVLMGAGVAAALRSAPAPTPGRS